jgi:hypothetical protein
MQSLLYFYFYLRAQKEAAKAINKRHEDKKQKAESRKQCMKFKRLHYKIKSTAEI